MTVPVTIIGGYLGAGKTTLINRLLAANDPAGLAVMVNDFGTINVDAELLSVSSDGRIISFANGCICCSMQDDFASALENLQASGREIRHVLVEASGVASPANLKRESRLPGFHPRGCLVVVDADNFSRKRTDRYVGQLLERQIREADWLYVNRQTADPLFSATHQRQLNDDEVINLNWQATVSVSQPDEEAVPAFESITLHQHRPITRRELNQLLGDLPDWVERVKGFVDASGRHMLVQQTANRFEVTPVESAADPALVFIVPAACRTELEAHLRSQWLGWKPGT